MGNDKTLEAMERYGGSFVKALAACYRTADAENRAKLYAAFEDLFTEYEDVARLAANRKAIYG